MRRYPHTATIEVTTETKNDSGIPEVQKNTFPVEGRYEPSGQNVSLDQSAKFYCKWQPEFESEDIAGQRLFIFGKWIGISQVFNYQFHCELWLD